MSLENYFEWFLVPENQKVKFVKLKLKGLLMHGGEI